METIGFVYVIVFITTFSWTVSLWIEQPRRLWVVGIPCSLVWPVWLPLTGLLLGLSAIRSLARKAV